MSPWAKPLSSKEVCVFDTTILSGLTTSPGDCAELFDYCHQDMIEAKVKLLLQMSLVLIWGMSPLSFIVSYMLTRLGANRPVVRIARIAGQFAKYVLP